MYKITEYIENNNYGKFELEPLERGFGTTIGNALRRVMLSNMPGSAIVAVKIDGAMHEFQALDGIVEDVTTIVLNLKNIVIKKNVEEEKVITLFADKEGVVTAGDIKTDGDVEIINKDQVIANIASPLFGGIPATGAIARTATNIKNGGKTPMAGIIHAVVLLLIMMLLGKFAVYIPMAALSAVLVSVAWNMAGLPAVKALLKGQKSDICVLLVTFLITVFVDLTVAIEVGLGFAAFFFIKKMIDVSEVQTKHTVLTGGISDIGKEEELEIPEKTVVYEIDGPLFFGTVRKFELAMEKAEIECKAFIVRMRNTNYVDAGGLKALEQCKEACDRKNITIILSGVHTQPYVLMEKTGMLNLLGKENVFENISSALQRAKEIVSGK